MPFEPGIVGSGDQEWDDLAELELPDELALLGSQLQDDAAYLARRYPAHYPEVPDYAQSPQQGLALGRDRAPGRGLRRWMLGAAAAVALVAAGTWAMSYWTGRRDQTHSVSKAPPVGDDGRLARLPAPTFDAAESPPEEAPMVTVPAFQQGAFLWDVTGPELEGVLDLMESDASEGARLSI